MDSSNVAVARRAYQAYADSDRRAIDNVDDRRRVHQQQRLLRPIFEL